MRGILILGVNDRIAFIYNLFRNITDNSNLFFKLEWVVFKSEKK